MKKIILIPILVLFAILCVGNVLGALTDGLVIYFPFENQTYASVTDATGKYNLTAGTSVRVNGTGKVGNGHNYTGGDAANVDSGAVTTLFNVGKGDYTVAFWMLFDNSSTSNCRNAGSNCGWFSTSYEAGDGGIITKGTFIGNTTQLTTGNIGGWSSPTPGYSDLGWMYNVTEQTKWHFIVGRRIGGNATLIVDIQNQSIPFIKVEDYDLNNAANHLKVGGMRQSYYPMQGAIDEVGFWNRSLNYSELVTLYNNNVGLTYPFITSDTTSPTWSNNKDNSTATTPKMWNVIQLNVTMTDETGLSSYILATNQTGTMTNGSVKPITVSPFTMSENVTIAVPRGTFAWQVWFNDSSGNWANTTVLTASVKNTAPVISNPTLNTTLFTNDIATCLNGSYVDVDNDPKNGIFYRWLLNGTIIAGQTTTTLNLSTAGNRGDKIMCEWIADDSLENATAWLGSANTTISNTIPTISNPTLNTTLYTNDIAVCVNGSYVDVDNDPKNGVFYRWYLNGTIIGGQTLSNLNLSVVGNGNINDKIMCEWIADDGLENATSWLGSANTTITNAPPTITFIAQNPIDLNITNAQNNKFKVNYTITDIDGNLDNSTIFLYYKSNSSISNIMYFQNGTSYSGYFPSGYQSDTSAYYYWELLDNQIYPGTYNTGAVSIDHKVHTATTLANANQYIKTEYYNISDSQQWGYFEVMANSTATALPISAYYCNSSYTTGNIVTNTNCVVTATRTATEVYDHCHTNTSCHIGFQFAVNTTTGKIGNVKVTSTSYFLIGGAKDWNIWSINEVTRAGMTQSTPNKGLTFTTETYTIDEHIHQFDTEHTNTTFYYYVCANDTLSASSCSPIRTDLMEIAGLPPTSVQVYNPAQNNLVSGNVKINYTMAESPNSYSISYYNISLANETNGAFIQSITLNNSNNLSYVWDSSSILSGTYIISVGAFDVLGQNSMGYSENFTIDNVKPYWSNNQTNMTANSPKKSEVVQLNVTITDDLGLSYYVLAHNMSGTMTNQTMKVIPSNPFVISENLTITSGHGNLRWQVWFNDSASNTANTTEFDLVIYNTKPTITAPSINLSINTDDMVTCLNGSYVDIDGDAKVGSFYRWLLNGTMLPAETTNMLNLSVPGNGNVKDLIMCEWIADDGLENATAWIGSPNTTITDNTMPYWSGNMTNATITAPRYSETVQLNVTMTDESGLSYYVLAHNMSGTMTNQTFKVIPSNPFTMVENLTITAGRGNLLWQVFFNDTSNNWANTTAFNTLIHNAMPIITNPTFNATIVMDNDTLLCLNGSYVDIDGDAKTNDYYRWYLNGTLITGETATILNTTIAGNGDNGDKINCEWIASDGYENATIWLPTNNITIGLTNTAPPQVTVFTSPNSNYSNMNITFIWTPVIDIDGDTVYYQFYLNNSMLQNATQSNISVNFTAEGNYSYIVGVWDNISSGLNSTTRYIMYDITPPSVNTIILTPALNFTRIDSYNVSVNITDSLSPINGSVIQVKRIVKGSTNCVEYYINGTCASSSPTNYTLSSSTGDLFGYNLIKETSLYPRISFADENVFNNNNPQSYDLNKYEYYVINMTNNYGSDPNVSAIFEIDARKKATTTKPLLVYLVDKSQTNSLFSSEWFNSNYVEMIGAINVSENSNHLHTSNSSHYIIPITTNSDGTIGSKKLDISSNFYIVLFSFGSTQSDSWNLSYRNSTVCSNNGNLYRGNLSGWSLNSVSGCLDLDLLFKRNGDGLNVSVYTNDSSGNVKVKNQTFYFGNLENLKQTMPTFKNVPSGNVSGPLNLSWSRCNDINFDTITYNITLVSLNTTRNYTLSIGMSGVSMVLDTKTYANESYDIYGNCFDSLGNNNVFRLSDSFSNLSLFNKAVMTSTGGGSGGGGITGTKINTTTNVTTSAKNVSAVVIQDEESLLTKVLEYPLIDNVPIPTSFNTMDKIITNDYYQFKIKHLVVIILGILTIYFFVWVLRK